MATDSKSNEITAIPKLLEILDISGALVTIDAMGCQTEIAQKILEGGADYALTVKKNQWTLFQGLHGFFEAALENGYEGVKVRSCQTEEEGHGRKEFRSYDICPVPADLPDRERWPGLKAIGVVISSTIRDGKDCVQMRYYILSKFLSARSFAKAARGHWGIENSLHWQLDVSFREDECRVRKGHADENFSVLRRTALSMLKNESTAKMGVKNKRLAAGWDDAYLEQVLVGT